MGVVVQFLKIFAGIGLFLFAMYLLEESLKNLSGRKLKRFLQRISKSRMGAVAGGTIATGILQSSSMVVLMVLAFVGTGVFTMKNAMAIILGANLGTTFNSWLVALFGFKFNIEVVAYPVVFVGGMLLILFKKRPSIKYLSYFLLGFGLLFISLPFIRTAMESEVKGFDFTRYAHMPLIVFLLIGFIVTVIVQTSSVTMVLVLSALHAGVIDFAPAAAIVLGSETGTTLKLLLGAIGANASKKRVVFGNLFVNIFISILAFSLLRPMLLLITDVFKIKDLLMALVTFSTMVNILSILVFLPFLNLFAKLLEKLFKDADDSAAAFIGHANINDPENSLELFRNETKYFIYNSMLFNQSLFGIEPLDLAENTAFNSINAKRKFLMKSMEEKYEFMKQLQGEIQVFYLQLREKLQGTESYELNQIASAVRNAIYALKSMKDVAGNIHELQESSKDIKFDLFVLHKKEIENLYQRFNALLVSNEKLNLEKLQVFYKVIEDNYTSALNNFYKEARHADMDDMDMTTVINFNRELFTSNKAMLSALKDFLLDEKQIHDFNEIPTESI